MDRLQHGLIVVLISWVDWPEIGSLVEEVSTQPVDRALAQSVDSSRRAVKRVLFLGFCRPPALTARNDCRGSTEQPARPLGHLSIENQFCAEQVAENDQGESAPAY